MLFGKGSVSYTHLVSPDGRKIWAAGHLPAGKADGDFTAAALTLVEDGLSLIHI